MMKLKENDTTTGKKKINKKMWFGILGGLSAIFVLALILILNSITIGRLNQVTVIEEQEIVAEVKFLDEVLLDVPLLYQFDEPSLYNGCEVTALAMIMNYHGIEVTKNELADGIAKVPYEDENGLLGNPNVGFVGDISGWDESGLGVYHKPVAQVLGKYVPQEAINDISGSSFDAVLQAVTDGQPVWVITTVNFYPVDDIEVWKTAEGDVEISYSMHSVVVVGYDQDTIYINDPYGEKDYGVEKEGFIDAFNQMGKQAIYIEK